MLDITESQLRVPARTGVPVRLSHMPGELVHPSFSAAIGMILYAQRTRMSGATQGGTWRSRFGEMFGGSY
jgi:cell division protein FtsA